jgi:hypothetical protein
VDISGSVCGDPVANAWDVALTLTFEGDTQPLQTVTDFGDANPAPIFTHTFEVNGEEKGRITVSLLLGPGPDRQITPQWTISGDVVNVTATPAQVPATAQTLAACPAATNPPPPPPPPPPPGPTGGAPVTGGPTPGRAPGTVKLPGTSTFVPVKAGQSLPAGTIVDVSNGKGIRLTDAKGNALDIYGEKDGVPSMAKIVRTSGLVELQLMGGNFKACGKRVTAVAGKVEKPVRRLWAKGKGKFRTKGRFISATIRGTWWETRDFCDRSGVRVKEGSVLATNLITKQKKVVPKGKIYSVPKP